MTIVTFGGAGNAGKTTVLDLLAKYMALDGHAVLGIDSNPDQTLLSFAGLTDEDIKTVPPLCAHFDQLKTMLEGSNPFYPDLKKVVGSSPVTPHSKRWQPHDLDDPIIQSYSIAHRGVRYMQTGTYEAADIGNGCLHSKIEGLVFALQRLDDGRAGEKSVTLIDQAHGRDAFGTPVYAQGDILLIVSKADRKSLDILHDYLSISREIEAKIGHQINIGVVGNGVTAPEQINRIRDTAGKHYITSLYNDPTLYRDISNAGPDIHHISKENFLALGAIADVVTKAERVPLRRKVWMDFCHGKKDWMDAMYGPDVRAQKTEFVPGAECHVHGPGCKHGH